MKLGHFPFALMQGLFALTISQVYLTNLVAKGFGSKLAKNQITKTETFILASNSFTLWRLNIHTGTSYEYLTYRQARPEK